MPDQGDGTAAGVSKLKTTRIPSSATQQQTPPLHHPEVGGGCQCGSKHEAEAVYQDDQHRQHEKHHQTSFSASMLSCWRVRKRLFWLVRPGKLGQRQPLHVLQFSVNGNSHFHCFMWLRDSCASSHARSTVYIPGVSPSPTSATATAESAGLDQADQISPQLAALAAETAEKLAAQKSLGGRWLCKKLSQLRTSFDCGNTRVVLWRCSPAIATDQHAMCKFSMSSFF